MRWRTKVTLSFLAIAMAAMVYVITRHQGIDIRTSGTARRQPALAVGALSPSHSIQPLWRTVAGDRQILTPANPLAQGRPKAGNVSFQVTGASMEEVAVRAALEMMKGGNFNGARELLKTAISRTSRGNTYLSFGRPDHISNGTGPHPSEIWHYDAVEGTTPVLFPSSAGRPKHPVTAYLDPGDSQAGASAFWAYTFSFYREGGYANLREAATQFQDFLAIFPNGPDDLVQAAQLDIGVIDLELMGMAPTLGYKVAAAKEAANALMVFMARWPGDPKAYAASSALLNVQGFLLNPR